MAKNDVDKLHKQKGEKNKPITRMKAERNVWVHSQLRTEGSQWRRREGRREGERGGERGEKEKKNNEGIILEN